MLAASAQAGYFPRLSASGAPATSSLPCHAWRFVIAGRDGARYLYICAGHVTWVLAPEKWRWGNMHRPRMGLASLHQTLAFTTAKRPAGTQVGKVQSSPESSAPIWLVLHRKLGYISFIDQYFVSAYTSPFDVATLNLPNNCLIGNVVPARSLTNPGIYALEMRVLLILRQLLLRSRRRWHGSVSISTTHGDLPGWKLYCCYPTRA